MSTQKLSFIFKSNNKKSDDIEIPRLLAEQMAAAYRSHPNALSINGATLNGLRLKKSSLDFIFNQKPNLKEVFLMFGVHPDALSLPPANQYFTIAVVGISDDGTPEGLIENDSSIFDYLEPCPDRCAKNSP